VLGLSDSVGGRSRRRGPIVQRRDPGPVCLEPRAPIHAAGRARCRSDGGVGNDRGGGSFARPACRVVRSHPEVSKRVPRGREGVAPSSECGRARRGRLAVLGQHRVRVGFAMSRPNFVPRTAILRTDGARLGRGPARAATGWCPRVDHRRRVPRWRLHPGRIPPSLGLVTRLRGPRHGRPRSPPRPLCVPAVGAPGPSVQLLPSGLQVPVHPEETGWGIGRLETWNQTMNGRAVRRARLCPPCARGCGLRQADAKIALWNAQVGTGSPGGAEIWTGSSSSSARYEVVYRCSSFRGHETSRTPRDLRDARPGPKGGAGSGPGLRSRRWLRSSWRPG